MMKTSMSRFLFPRAFLCLSLCVLGAASCTRYVDWKVATAYELTATRLDPSSGEAVDEAQSLGMLTPPAGASYLYWASPAKYAGAESGGLALMELGSCVKSSDYNGAYYDEGGIRSLALLATLDAFSLQEAPGAAPYKVVGGAYPLLLANGSAYALDSGPALVDSGLCYPRTGWLAAATWKAASASGLVAAYGLRQGALLCLDTTDYALPNEDSFAASHLGYAGGSSFFAPFYGYTLDAPSGRTVKTLSILGLGLGSASPTVNVLGSYEVEDATNYGCLFALPDGLLRIGDSRLIRVGLDGVQKASVDLGSEELEGEALIGPSIDAGILFTPSRLGDERVEEGSATTGYSRYSNTPAKTWAIDSGATNARFVAALWLADSIVIIRARPVDEVTITHAYFPGF